MENSVFHATLFYTGHVQGVGFGYFALQASKEFEVAGYVTNLTDGRVCIEAAGDETEVLDFKREIENRMQAFIRKVELRTQNCPLRFSGFIIR